MWRYHTLTVCVILASEHVIVLMVLLCWPEFHKWYNLRHHRILVHLLICYFLLVTILCHGVPIYLDNAICRLFLFIIVVKDHAAVVVAWSLQLSSIALSIPKNWHPSRVYYHHKASYLCHFLVYLMSLGHVHGRKDVTDRRTVVRSHRTVTSRFACRLSIYTSICTTSA